MKCPFCGEEIQEEAVKCRYCKEWLSKPAESVRQPSEQLDRDQPQAMSSTSAIKGEETLVSRNAVSILAAFITFLVVLAVGIPFYLVKQDRSHKVQTKIEQASAPAPEPSPVTGESALPPGYKALILQADISLDAPPARAVDIFFKYKPEGSKRYVTEILMQNVPVVSYSAEERQIEIHIPAEDVENLQDASDIGTVQVLPIR